jgi:hypothetical protein
MRVREMRLYTFYSTHTIRFFISSQQIFKDHNRNLVNGEIAFPLLTTKTAIFTIDHARLLCSHRQLLHKPQPVCTSQRTACPYDKNNHGEIASYLHVDIHDKRVTVVRL